MERSCEFWGSHIKWETSETRLTLRALASTCKSLRAFTLPLLWRVVHIKQMRELSVLQRVLRSAPEIAELIHCFCFMWDMDGDFSRCEAYDPNIGSLLDLAFRNRWRIWESAKDRVGCEIEWSGADMGFLHNGIWYVTPGTLDLYHDEDDMPVPNDNARRERGHGPDGEGPDGYIKNAHEFEVCIVDVVTQLTSLRTFGWCSPVAPMPREVLQHLEAQPTLTSLHVTLSSWRGSASLCECGLHSGCWL